MDPASVGLSSFGKPSGFYNRQIATFGTISEMQAQAVDVETHVPVGKIPHFDDMVVFFKDGETQPRDRATLIHGDYKIDNLVFHKTEPRVIGILEYVSLSLSLTLSLLCSSSLSIRVPFASSLRTLRLTSQPVGKCPQ